VNRRGRALGALALAAGLSLTAACGGGGSSNSSKGLGFNAASKGQVLNASTKKGGTLKLWSPQDVDFLDPARAYYGFVWTMQRLYVRQLLSYDSKPGAAGNKLVPDLATAQPTVTNGGKTYTFKLKSGIKFSTGAEITSQDIKYGIERTFAQDVLSGGPVYLINLLDQGQNYKGPYKDKSKTGLKSVLTPDNKTIVFNLKTANSDFPYLMAMSDSSPVPQASDDGAKYTNHPVSSGPYQVASFTAGKGAVFTRNKYWDQKTDTIRTALPDKVTFTVTSNPDDMDSRLLSGDIDYAIDGTGVGQAAKIKILQNTKYKANADNGYTGYIRYFSFPTTVKPFDNVNCRKAVIYAADPTSLQTARGGPTSGDIGTNMLPTNVPGSDKSYDPYNLAAGKPQVAKAKAALAACGKPNGFTTTIAVRNNKPAEVKTAESLQASLKAVGITANIDQYDGSQSSSVIGSPDNVKKKGYGIIVMGWGADYNTGSGFLQALVDGRFILSNGNNNYSMTNDKTINGLFDKAASELTTSAAAADYKKINELVMEKALYLPINFDKSLTYRNPELTNVFINESQGGRLDPARLGVLK
jgi:peptide/nickel transport system substrate-binding protein